MAITDTMYCDFVVWTLVDVFIERIHMDQNVWQEMTKNLSDYYYHALGPEIIRRLLEM